MRRCVRLTLCAALLLATTACARTVYTNLHPQTPVPAVPPAPDSAKPQAWRHFFLFGWVPGELLIDAEAYCHGSEHVERIETQESFVQGLIASVAGYYINVYSPYTGRVVCDRHAAAAAAPEPPDAAPAGP